MLRFTRAEYHRALAAAHRFVMADRELSAIVAASEFDRRTQDGPYRRLHRAVRSLPAPSSRDPEKGGNAQ